MFQRQWTMWIVSSILALHSFNGACQATTITVGSTDQYDFQTLYNALADANRGDTILVADGVYQGDFNRSLSINVQNLTLKSINGPENCIIDCQGQSRALDLACGSEECIIDGFNFTQGAAREGGAIRIVQPDITRKPPVIKNCIFTSNIATEEDGGAIYVNYGEALIINCSFMDNQSADDGGAIAIRGGDAFHREAANEIHLINCSFTGNHARDNGGAMFARGTALSMNRCFIAGNESGAQGGGAYFREASPIIMNTVFSGNHALSRGGALYSRKLVTPTLLFCTLYGNHAGVSGAAIAAHAASESMHLLGCIGWDNTLDTSTDEPYPVFDTGQSTLQDCWIQGVDQATLPLFVDADGADNFLGTHDDNFQLRPESPCIDATQLNVASWGMQKDCAGFDRLQGTNMDMGAYEFGFLATDPNAPWSHAPVIVTELLAHTGDGSIEDWVELHNTTEQAIDISGWWLTDENRCQAELAIPPGSIIEPNGLFVFYRDVTWPFGLNNYGEYLTLCSTFAGLPTGYRHTITFPASLYRTTLIRHANSVGLTEYVSSSENTPGLSNAAPSIGPIVISEFVVTPKSGHTQASYIELVNISDLPVDLSNNSSGNPWHLLFDLYDEEQVVSLDSLPSLQPGEICLVAEDPNLLRELYPSVPPSVPILGPWVCELSSLGGRITVKQYRHRASISDRVNYGAAHMPTYRCGPSYWMSTSLQENAQFTRIDLHAYGNDPNNWISDPPTPGTITSVVE